MISFDDLSNQHLPRRRASDMAWDRKSGLDMHHPEVLLHELQLHQAELEMQNEQLRQAQVELEKSRDRYVDFYDFAPVGYITFSRDGMIDSINLTGAALLGVERSKLVGHRFATFVAPEDRDKWHSHLRHAITQDNVVTCELKLRRRDDSPFFAQLDCLRMSSEGKAPQLRIVMTDISERKQMELLLRESENNLRESQRIAGIGGYLLDVRRGDWKSSEVLDQLLGIDDSYDHSVAGWEALLHPEDRTSIIDCLRKDVIDQRKDFDRQFRIIRHNDHAERWMHGLGRLEFDAQHYPAKMHGTLQDITERVATEDKINQLAFYDSLTQLPNRCLLADRLDKAISNCHRNGKYGAVLFLDLDNFKPLNDVHGHSAGDLLLVEVAHRLSICVREVDTVARFGGDEFVVVLNELDVDQAASIIQSKIVAKKILSDLNGPYWLSLNDEDTTKVIVNHQCSASIGVALFDGKSSAEKAIKWADKAMYQAKAAGRNQIRLFEQ